MPGPCRPAWPLLAVAVLVTACASASAAPVESTPTPPLGTSSGTSSWPPPSSGPVRVVGLGDSVPAGSACGCTPYVELVAAGAGRRTGRATTVENFAEGGLTTADVLDQLDDDRIAAGVAAADLVIVTVGANDLDDDALAGPSDVPVETLPAYRRAMARQRADLDALLLRVETLRAGRAGAVLVTGYWNVFLDGPVALDRGTDYVADSNAVTLADNALIAAAAAAHDDEYVDLYTPFKGDGHPVDAALLASDGDHPSEAGHRLIARTLLDLLF